MPRYHLLIDLGSPPPFWGESGNEDTSALFSPWFECQHPWWDLCSSVSAETAFSINIIAFIHEKDCCVSGKSNSSNSSQTAWGIIRSNLLMSVLVRKYISLLTAIKLTAFGHQLSRLRACWSEPKSPFGEYGHMLTPKILLILSDLSETGKAKNGLPPRWLYATRCCSYTCQSLYTKATKP